MDSLAIGLQSALAPLDRAGKDLVRIYPAGAADEVEENLCRLDALFKGSWAMTETLGEATAAQSVLSKPRRPISFGMRV